MMLGTTQCELANGAIVTMQPMSFLLLYMMLLSEEVQLSQAVLGMRSEFLDYLDDRQKRKRRRPVPHLLWFFSSP